MIKIINNEDILNIIYEYIYFTPKSKNELRMRLKIILMIVKKVKLLVNK